MKPDNLEKLARADSAADSLLTRIVASRWTAFIVGGALVAAFFLGASMF